MITNIILASFFFLLLAVPFIFSSSVQETPKVTKAYLQIQIRDSDGRLTAYVEPTNIKIYYPALVDSYLDEKPKETIIFDGKKFQKIQFVEQGKFNIRHSMAGYELDYPVNSKAVKILGMWHDGYPVQPGDTIKASWVFLRPVSQ